MKIIDLLNEKYFLEKNLYEYLEYKVDNKIMPMKMNIMDYQLILYQAHIK